MRMRMNSKTTIPVTEARANFFDIIEKVDETGVRYVLTVNGVPKAVIMNAEEFESWQETLDIMSNPELVRGIEESEKEIREGKYSTFEEVFGMTPEQALREKPRKKYKKSKRK